MTRSKSLRKSAQQALIWSAGMNLFRDGLQFIQMLILVRLLDPEIYGMAGLATTVIHFIGIASFQHFVGHVIQVRSENAVDYHQHFSFGLVINGTLFLLANVVAICLRFFDDYASLQPLVHVLSFSFLLAVPVDLRVKMLEREHRWSRLRPLQMAGVLISVFSCVSLALAGAGVYAIVLPGLIYTVVFFIDLFFVLKWQPRWVWKPREYRDALNFGFNRAGSNALNSGRKLLESGLITRHFDFASLGVFGRAEGLSNLFCERVSQQVMSALYPVITRADIRSDRFRRIAGLVLRSVAWVVIPMAVFFSIEAANVVELLYGSKWLAVVPLLPLAMMIGASRSIGSAAYQLLLANEERKLCLRLDMAAFGMAALAMLTLIPLGILSYMAGASVVMVVITTILLTLLVRTQGIAAGDVLTALAPPSVAASLAAVVIRVVASNFSEQIPQVLSTIFVCVLFFAVYLLVLRLFFRPLLVQIVEYVPGGRRVASILRC